MGNFFSKLKRRFRGRHASHDQGGGRTRSVYTEGLLREVTERSLLLDASELNSEGRSTSQQFWKSPFECRANFRPAIISICINRDLGIGEITGMCHRFRLEDVEGLPNELDEYGRKQSRNEGENRRGYRRYCPRSAGSKQKNSDSSLKGAFKTKSCGSNETEKDGSDENVALDMKEPNASTGSGNLTDEDKKRNKECQNDESSADSKKNSSSEGEYSHSHSECSGNQTDRENQPHSSTDNEQTGKDKSSDESLRSSQISLGQKYNITDDCRYKAEVDSDSEDSWSDGDLFGQGKLDVINIKVDELDNTPPSEASLESWCSNASESDYPLSTPSNSGSVASCDEEVREFPAFVSLFLNKDVRIRLQFHKAIHSTFNSTYEKSEPVHLWRQVKYIDARFLGHPYQQHLKVMLEESHGCRRKPFGNSRRSRPLFPRAIILNTCPETPGLYVAGKEFSILLAPPPGGAQLMEDGRMMYSMGTYVRYLDTDQNYLMLWRATVEDEAVAE